jgi:hypothetical protein
VTWQAHVDDKTSSNEAAYDMIMGMDLMTSIGITVDCEEGCIRWGGTEIPLKTRNTLNNDEILHMLYHAANEPDILQEAEKRQNRILDADYRKVEVDPFVEEFVGSNTQEVPNMIWWWTGNVKYQTCKVRVN